MTGAYAEQAAKIIDGMNENFIKERFYAIPLESLPSINSHNANPRGPVKIYAQNCLQAPAECSQPAIEASYRAASKCFMFMYFLLPH